METMRARRGADSQRLSTPSAAGEASEHARVVWSMDLQQRRIGEDMAHQRGLAGHQPTAMRLAESRAPAALRSGL